MEQPEVTIRPFEERDAELIAALVQSSWSHDPVMREIYQEMHRVWQSESLIRRSLVATVNEKPVGVGTIFESTIHPRMLFVTLNVAVGWQRRGIGSRLWAALQALSDGRPWLLKTTRADVAGMSFLRKRGFHPLLGTLTGLLDPAQPAVQRWLSSLPNQLPGYRIQGCDEAPVTLAEVAQIHAAIYHQAHGWNPPAEKSIEATIAHYCGQNVVAGSQICVYHYKRLVGAANLIANPFQPSHDEAYLVNIGVVELPPPDAETLTGALIRRLLLFAAERGLQVRFEADDTHQPFQAWLLNAPAAEVDHDFMIMSNADPTTSGDRE